MALVTWDESYSVRVAKCDEDHKKLFVLLNSVHEAMKADTPPPYPNVLAAYREIIPALIRQTKDPAWHIVRPLPGDAKPFADYEPFANAGSMTGARLQ